MNKESIVLAGGCFWCTEAIFRKLEGVYSVEPGYSGGETANPSYEQVCTGSTGHAEAIKIEYDSNLTSLADLLDIFWRTHDPTTLNRQGNDVGTQYRSAIFYETDKQKMIAERIKETLETEGVYPDPILTEIVPYTNFYLAEDYHKNYFEKNQNAPYCQLVIKPKLDKLHHLLEREDA